MDEASRALLRETDGVLALLEEVLLSKTKELPPEVQAEVQALLDRLEVHRQPPTRTKRAIALVFRLQERWLAPEPPPRRRPQVLQT